ncbi:MAG: 16S rRNA (guanine(527)-N(7))-methyltransferase RsmG [Parerythrobacter sp.]
MIIETEDSARDYVASQCSERQFAMIERYAELLLVENKAQNLIARASEDALWVRHIADSIQLCDSVSRETVGRWLDLGSGPGLPGLMVALVQPELRVILVESRRKRWEWLDRVVARLGLPNVQVVGKRVQMIDAEPVSYISARAFAPLRKTLEVAAAFSTHTTRWILPKGQSASQELSKLPKWLKEGFHVKQSLTSPDAGIVTGSLTRSACARLTRNAQ